MNSHEKYLADQVKKQYIEEKGSPAALVFPEYSIGPERLFELNELLLDTDIASYHNNLENGRLSPSEAVMFYLERIKENESLNAVISINPEVFTESASAGPGRLHGVPILIKDNIAVRGMPLTAGSRVLLDNMPLEDSSIVKRLKSEGAIILGKANLSEWANFMTRNSSNGFSSAGGQTKNPHGNFDVGGSSSGSAAAVSASLCMAAIGSETSGSLVYPASQNGVVTIKPEVGQVPGDGIIPISYDMDVAGPMTRLVSDAALIYEIISGTSLEKANVSSVGFVSNIPVKDWYRPDDIEIENKIRTLLEAENITVKDIFFDEKVFDIDIMSQLLCEFKYDLDDYFTKEKNGHLMEKVLREFKLNQKTLAPYGFDIFEDSFKCQQSEDECSRLAAKNKKIASDAIKEALKETDVLACISNYSTSVYAIAGYPAVNVPLAIRETGEPVGVTFFGAGADVWKLISMASRFEKMIKR